MGGMVLHSASVNFRGGSPFSNDNFHAFVHERDREIRAAQLTEDPQNFSFFGVSR